MRVCEICEIKEVESEAYYCKACCIDRMIWEGEMEEAINEV